MSRKCALNQRPSIITTRFLHPCHTNPVLLLGVIAPSSAAWPQVLTHSSSDVPVAFDAAASSVATASTRRPRLARPKNDGGNNASADNQRTDAHDAHRTLQSRSADRCRDADLPRRLTTTYHGMHQPGQHPLRPHAARLLSLVRRKPRRNVPAGSVFNSSVDRDHSRGTKEHPNRCRLSHHGNA